MLGFRAMLEIGVVAHDWRFLAFDCPILSPESPPSHSKSGVQNGAEFQRQMVARKGVFRVCCAAIA
jgi:hypothetical protein